VVTWQSWDHLITVLTGLEVMLLQQKGVARASAATLKQKVIIGFDNHDI